jgi:hypothetical protein
MSQDELNAIVDLPMERGCGAKQQGKKGRLAEEAAFLVANFQYAG